MNSAEGRRLIGLIAVAGVLAAAGGGVTVAVTAGRNGVAREVAVAAGEDRPAPAAAAASPSRQFLDPSPSTFAADAVSPAPTASRALAAAAAKPPPVVDGVRRFNVGSAHSPQLARALSGGSAKTPGVLPSTAGARGIDVASYQHPKGAAIDWAQAARAGYKFAFVKASEGNYYANPYYGTDLTDAKAAGLYVTGYHFAVPNVSSGASQADYAVKQSAYAADGRTMPLALDIEYNPYGGTCYGLTAARMVAWISSFTAEARRLTGQLPIIYSTADWWHSCTQDSTAFGSDPLWIAAWGSSPGSLPSGWRDWTFWQYTSHGQVPGVSGNVDVSYFGKAAVRLLDPGSQSNPAGTAIRLQVTSLNAVSGQAPSFTAAGLPGGLSISGSGLVTGTISAGATGGHAVTVTATTASGGTGSVSFTWTVTSPPSPSPAASPSPTAAQSAASEPASPSPSQDTESPALPAPDATPSPSAVTNR